MDDERDTAAQNGKGNTSSKGGNILVSSAILAVVCGAASFAMVYFLAPSEASESAACPTPGAMAAGPAPLASADTSYVELEDMLITVGDGADNRYVKLRAVVMTPTASAADVEGAAPMLTDAFLTYLRAIDISDFEAESFYPDLKEQLSRRAELVLGAERARGVLITEFMLR